MKECSRCKKVKPKSMFIKNRKNKDGLTYKCAECRNKRAIQTYYSISAEFIDRLFDQQNGSCAICNRKLKKYKNTVIDHCHISNQVRGILCNACNLGLGNFKDKITTIESAIIFLKEHK